MERSSSTSPWGIITGHFEKNTDHLLGLSAVLGAERGCADVEERRLALGRNGFGQHCLSRSRRAEHQNACPGNHRIRGTRVTQCNPNTTEPNPTQANSTQPKPAQTNPTQPTQPETPHNTTQH